MTLGEIGTAVSHKINTVCIVMNNGCWGAEKAYQRDFFGERYIGADVPNPPTIKLPSSMAHVGFASSAWSRLRRSCVRPGELGKTRDRRHRVDPNALFVFRRDSFKHRDKSAK